MTAVGPFNETPLMAGAPHLDGPAVMTAGRTWSWREVHLASLELAGQLQGAPAVCNLCDSRLGFLVTMLAAARSGCVQVLPPSGGQSDLASILQQRPGTIVVGDHERVMQASWKALARCLVHVPRLPDSAVPDARLAWQCDFDAPLVTLHSSGSTGVPQAHAKTLGQLMRGAQVLKARLDADIEGGAAALERIVCSVPPQHMFGLETSVMLPLLAGIPVVDTRPLLPADIRAALPHGAAAAWIATPLHLRALLQTGEPLRGCRAIVASTMALARDLAGRAEVLAGAPILEIYGSTETGVVAMRRTARDEQWTPVQDVRMEPLDDGTRVSGAHFASPQTLADLIDAEPGGRFVLLGRRGDMIKIAGRRASLAGLNLLLQDLPGLGDGIFYLPATGELTERLVLIYDGPPLDRAATQRWLRERMDPAFLPRALLRVDKLPRGPGGKLPRAALDATYAACMGREREA